MDQSDIYPDVDTGIVARNVPENLIFPEEEATMGQGLHLP